MALAHALKVHHQTSIDLDGRNELSLLKRQLARFAGLAAGPTRFVVWTFFVLLGIGFANSSMAQVANWERTVAAGKKEGRVVVYSVAVPALNDRIRADFESLHPGYSVAIVRLFGPTLRSKVEQERQIGADGADVIINSDAQWVQAGGREGWFNAPVGPARTAWPNNYLIPGGAVTFALDVVVIGYNTKLASIGSYQDLLKPEYKGKIAVQLNSAAVVMAYYKWMEDTLGADYVKRLAAQQPKIDNSVPNAQSVAAGEVVATAYAVPSMLAELASQGAPIKWVVPRPASGFAFQVGALKWSRRPNASQVFLDYLMSPRGQAVIVGEKLLASPLPGIEGSLDLSNVAVVDTAKWTPESMNAYKKTWDALFLAK